MATEIKYTDGMGNEISISETLTVEQFNKVFIVDGVRTKSEFFNNQGYQYTNYNVRSMDDILQILKHDPNANFWYSYLSSCYSITESLCYKNAALVSKLVRVYKDSSQDDDICWAKIEVKDNNEKIVDIEKYYTIYGEEKYLFTYDSQGNCEKIYGQDGITEDVYPSQIGVHPDVKFTWDGFEYYRYARPLVPEK